MLLGAPERADNNSVPNVIGGNAGLAEECGGEIWRNSARNLVREIDNQPLSLLYFGLCEVSASVNLVSRISHRRVWSHGRTLSSEVSSSAPL
jgi:hypothetical protein